MTLANYLETKVLDKAFRGVDFTVASVWVKLHTGDPGEDCTSNPAANTTRKLATFAAAASGAITTDADIDWTSVSAGETYAYVSLWDASTSGNALASGAMTTPRTVVAGDNFKIPAGDLDITLD